LPPCPASGQVAVGARDADTPLSGHRGLPRSAMRRAGGLAGSRPGPGCVCWAKTAAMSWAGTPCRCRWISVGCSIAGRGCGSGRAARAIPVGAGTGLRGRGDGAGRTFQLAPHPEHQQARLALRAFGGVLRGLAGLPAGVVPAAVRVAQLASAGGPLPAITAWRTWAMAARCPRPAPRGFPPRAATSPLGNGRPCSHPRRSAPDPW
jgi:hypothetical protein